MITTQATLTSGDRRGYALPVVIFVLVLLGVLGSASLQTSRDTLLSAKATSQAQAALLAAEAGLNAAAANWDQRAIDTLLGLSRRERYAFRPAEMYYFPSPTNTNGAQKYGWA